HRLQQARIGSVETLPPRILFAHAAVRPAPEGAGEPLEHILRQSEHLADIADGAAAAIADHGSRQAGAIANIFLVDVLDDLFAPLMLEIDIDIGRLLPLL